MPSTDMFIRNENILIAYKSLSWQEALEQKKNKNSLFLSFHPLSKELFFCLFSKDYNNVDIIDNIIHSINVI